MDVTLPYFLPAPPPWFFIGTLGAFIRMKSPAQHRQALLYIAAAGPIAGFCVAIPAVLCLCHVDSGTLKPNGRRPLFGEPLLLQSSATLCSAPFQGFALHINSVGVAAWFGLVVTMFNLSCRWGNSTAAISSMPSSGPGASYFPPRCWDSRGDGIFLSRLVSLGRSWLADNLAPANHPRPAEPP